MFALREYRQTHITDQDTADSMTGPEFEGRAMSVNVHCVAACRQQESPNYLIQWLSCRGLLGQLQV